MSRKTVDKENVYTFIVDCYQCRFFLLLRSRLNIMSLCECVPGGGCFCIEGIRALFSMLSIHLVAILGFHGQGL